MTTVVLVLASIICVMICFMLLFAAGGSLEKVRGHLKNMKSLEDALKDQEVVQIIQKMIRDPYVENVPTARQKRKNQKHALLRARLRVLVPDKQTRKKIYGFVKERTK